MTIVQPTVSIEEFDSLVDALPEGFTAELINGRIIVSPPPDGDHNENVVYIARQIHASTDGLQLSQEPGLAIDSYRGGRARPDGVVAPFGYFRGQPSWAEPSGVLLVLEVTSGREVDAEVDRTEKRDAYANTEIPVYLLLDRHRRQVVVHWAPSGGQYTHQSSVVFGEKLSLPAPLDFELDTAELV